MSNYGTPNGKNKGGQSAPAPSGQSPYTGYQQTGYQTGRNPSAYQNPYQGYGQYPYSGSGQNTNPGYPGNVQNTNPGYPGNAQNTNPGYTGGVQNTNPGYTGGVQNTNPGYPGNGQNPYMRPGNQMPYNTPYTYPQGYPNPMPGTQNQPYAGSAYGAYGNQQPYAGAQPGQQAYNGMQSAYSGPQSPVNGTYSYPGQMVPPQGYSNGPQQGGYARSNPQQRMQSSGQPQQKIKSRLPIEPEWLIVIVGAVLLVGLFLGSLFVAGSVLKWLFLAAAIVSLCYIWVRPVLNQGPKLTGSVLIGVAMLVTVLSMVLTPSADRTKENTNGNNTGNPVAPVQDDLAAAAVEEEGLGEWVAAEPVEVNIVTPTPDTTSATLENLSSFFYFWSVNNIENMLNYCAPSWVSKQTEPKVALFQVLSNRIAKSYTLGTPSGTDNDISRTVAVTATVDKRNGDSYSIYVFNVIMLKEEETWYVDPRSLQSHEEVEATTFSAVITQPPTPQPAEASMILYYNPDGGSYYHADPNCEAVAEKYRPLSGTFMFGQINEPAYADLKCCQRCAAPMRTSR